MDHSPLMQEFASVLQDEGLSDPAWVLELDDLDEPPLFSRCEQVDFLRVLSEDERGALVLKVGLTAVDAILTTIGSAHLPVGQEYSVALTLSDWDMLVGGLQSVPTVSLQVNPHKELHAGTPLLTKTGSRMAEKVQGWLDALGLEGRFSVGVNMQSEEDELFRVYVVPNVRRPK